MIVRPGVLKRGSADSSPARNPANSFRFSDNTLRDHPETAGYFWHLACITLDCLTATLIGGKQIPKKEPSHESQDEHESRQRTVGQLVLRISPKGPERFQTRASKS
jgi:hypothetical protein